MERRKEEKILWINSSNQELYPYYNSTTGTYENIITNPVNNKFDYNIGNILYVDNYKKLSVEMIDCAISKHFINMQLVVQDLIHMPLSHFIVL